MTTDELRAMTGIRFFVPGIPKPGGSKRAFYIPKIKRAVVTEDCKGSKDWRAVVALFGSMSVKEPLSGPLDVRYSFYFPRPRGHYGSGRNSALLKPSAPARHIVKPDLTKIIRSTEDALKGIAWGDDNQVCYQEARKGYVEPLCHPQPGCLIEIRECA